MGVTLEDGTKDTFFDQVWVECSECGCIQLLNLLPLSEIYKSNHHTEVVGGTWKEHHDAFSDYISSSAPKNILEIGAAHGYLATTLVNKFEDIKYTIVEPDSNLVDPRIRIIKGFIEDYLTELNNSDCIIHSHVLEHVYNPVAFINEISNNIKLGTSMFISFPNMDGLIKSGGLNSLNFEHSYLLDPVHAELIFKKSGFSIESRKEYLSHSYFYHLIKETDSLNIKPDYPNIHWLSQEFLQMVLSLKKFVQYAMKVVETNPSPVFIFGAHVFSQSLFSFGLNSQKIEGILDNAKEKQGKRLYGTPLLVMNPSVISELNEPIVVLHASHYQNEIKKQLFELNSSVRIIENFSS
jgi:2-polyprenyl-3-methyl-5-hydroxy-6-metoxy-1,4-benzoquinol methylase